MVNDENSRIRIHLSEAWIRGSRSGSTPKCHGSATLVLRIRARDPLVYLFTCRGTANGPGGASQAVSVSAGSPYLHLITPFFSPLLRIWIWGGKKSGSRIIITDHELGSNIWVKNTSILCQFSIAIIDRGPGGKIKIRDPEYTSRIRDAVNVDPSGHS
jgi:hypothetical protein